MGPPNHNKFKNRKIDKRFLSKNKTIKLFKEKQSKINLFQKEVDELKQKYEQITSEKIEKFDEFPLSLRTRKGLKECGYFTPTEIQKETILLSLQGRDILGAAKTGSGKTLAFVVPLLERLYVSGWSILDGLGVLIITPTRELAYQIYEVINKVGTNHQFSVALVIGGKDLAKERKLLDKCNIMICTPGRILQHMDENPLFDSLNLKMLILDEADRILDLGFSKTMDAIIENLPQERQTLLFSATQTKSVKDLARLSLKNPVYVSVDEHAKFTTPEALQQSYIVCEAHDKMNLLWSFIKSHKKQKILVFMASCKQVKFTYESICRLRPGVSIMALYGSLHQLKRMQIYDEFCKKIHVVMFATDVASRGLDFPNVNWVVQLDCPEDVNTYIHRAGRTARFQKGGESLLVLLPSEKESMVKQLTDRKIPIEEIKANPNKLQDVKRKLEAILLRDKNLKESGARGFKSYLKSIYLMKDKSVFDVMKIDVNQYANSLGLNFIPRIRFLEKHVDGFRNASVKDSHSNKNLQNDCDSDDEKTNDGSLSKKNSVENSDLNYASLNSGDCSKSTKDDIPRENESEDEMTNNDSSIINEDNAEKFLQTVKTTMRDLDFNCDSLDESDDDCLRSKNQTEIPDLVDSDEEKIKIGKTITKFSLVKRALKKNAKLNTVVKYDEEGNPLRKVGDKFVPDVTAELKLKLGGESNLESLKLLIQKEMELDKQLLKEKNKTKHKAEKLKKKEKRLLKNPAGAPPTLIDSEQDDSDEESVVDPNNMSHSESEEDNDQSEQLLSDENSGEASDRDVEESEESLDEASEGDSSGEEEISEEDQKNEFINFGTKRKKSSINLTSKKQRLNESQDKEKDVLGRTIEDDEQLALHFLNS